MRTTIIQDIHSSNTALGRRKSASERRKQLPIGVLNATYLRSRRLAQNDVEAQALADGTAQLADTQTSHTATDDTQTPLLSRLALPEAGGTTSLLATAQNHIHEVAMTTTVFLSGRLAAFRGIRLPKPSLVLTAAVGGLRNIWLPHTYSQQRGRHTDWSTPTFRYARWTAPALLVAFASITLIFSTIMADGEFTLFSWHHEKKIALSASGQPATASGNGTGTMAWSNPYGSNGMTMPTSVSSNSAAIQIPFQMSMLTIAPVATTNSAPRGSVGAGSGANTASGWSASNWSEANPVVWPVPTSTALSRSPSLPTQPWCGCNNAPIEPEWPATSTPATPSTPSAPNAPNMPTAPNAPIMPSSPGTPPVVVPVVPPVTSPVSVPPLTTPPISVPPVKAPPVTAPSIKTPPVIVPPVSVPPVTNPAPSLPVVPISPVAPVVTTPPVTVPPVTTPPVTAPPVTVPPVSTPPVAMPPVTVPKETTPTVNLPPVTPPSPPIISEPVPVVPVAPVITPVVPPVTAPVTAPVTDTVSALGL